MRQKPFNPGLLNHRVLVYSAQTSEESDQVTSAVCWAHVADISCNTELRSGHLESVIVYRIIVRYREDLVSGCRLELKSTVLRVIAVFDEVGDRNFLTVIAEVDNT